MKKKETDERMCKTKMEKIRPKRKQKQGGNEVG